MDIVRAFEASGLVAGGITINIKGTPDDPLFQANQVGELLGIVKIRNSIKDFDEDEVHVDEGGVHSMGTPPTFLTEVGLYRLIFASRKPFAKLFKKWVAKVVREIRATGRYELEHQKCLALESYEARDAEHRLALEAARAEIAAKEADAVIALAAKDAELARFRAKTYEQVPRLDKTYLNKDAAQLNTDVFKLGKAVDDARREAQLNTGSADGGRMVHVRDNSNGKLVEDVAKHALKRYHHAREHYSCRLEHAVDVIDIAAIVVDALASSYEFIARDDLIGRVIGQLEAARSAGAEVDEDEDGAATPGASEVREWRGEVRSSCSKLFEFLSLSDEMRVITEKPPGQFISEGKKHMVRIVREQDAYTPKEELRKWYRLWLGLGRDVASCDFNETDFTLHGFLCPAGGINMCKSCKKRSKSKCCAAYSPTNRCKLQVIEHMMMEVVEL
jgi:prophage antirepressor-like protein